MTELLLIPLDDTVLFPGMTVTIAAETADEERILVVPKVDGEYAEIGTIAEVLDTGIIPGGVHAATVRGLQRATPGAATTGSDGLLRVAATPHNDPAPDTERIDELERNYRAVVEEILELRGADDRIRGFLRSISTPG